MTIHVTPIPRLTTFGAPAFTVGDTNSAGDSDIAVASNSTLGIAATQAEQEAGSSAAKVTTPGRQQFHPSACKGWAKTVTTGGVDASYNVTSLTKNSTGDYTITWATDFSSTNYVLTALMSDQNGNCQAPKSSQATGTMRYVTQDSDHNNADSTVYFAAFGDQ